ncbi:endolytic transglycosylase MltG [Paenibacillus physcomitrellae]|uniref:Endolytic transglycosylase MltG n=1 Tax=Paenibacillus physcomitrellae TaxID=1619311 RepID=A0ABQ1G9R6_9BACL|nr:endolytic transglycosylase MltG [Paenibacillus physcomitrellae]GGA39512.1 hypothetical protein GCM10010917_25950 [Paenibacillus physcomitrellae]
MMRNRQFLFGLGAGLIIGALLLQLMNVAQTQPQMLNTEEAVRDAAKALGLRVYGSSEQVYSEQEWKERQASGTSSKGSSVTPSAPAEPSSPVSPDKPSEPAASSKAPAPPASPAPSNKSEEKAEVTIPAGTTLTEVAGMLKAAGIISDEEAFVLLAKEWNATRTIQTGTYTFTKGESFKSITDKITKNK